ncbi:MAG: Rrf2 family transcriptional regulator [Chitinophagaceae bacterium]|nr:Rrf2 family transcriptional regulator [Chitinophagaceae bacterium]
MFSKSCEYAIKALIFLGQESNENKKVCVKTISSAIDATQHFVAKILQDLTKKKLLKSTKGPNGGFYVDEENSKNSLADIIKAIDGTKIYSQCELGLKECSEKNPCPVHHEYKNIKLNLIKMIENNTISTFNTQSNLGKYFLKND